MNFMAAVVIDGDAILAAAATSATRTSLRLRLAVCVQLSCLPASLSICPVSLCTGRHPTESPPPSLFMRHQRRRRPVCACVSLPVCLLLSAPPKRSGTAHRHSATHSPSTSRSLPAAAAEPPPPRAAAAAATVTALAAAERDPAGSYLAQLPRSRYSRFRTAGTARWDAARSPKAVSSRAAGGRSECGEGVGCARRVGMAAGGRSEAIFWARPARRAHPRRGRKSEAPAGGAVGKRRGASIARAGES